MNVTSAQPTDRASPQREEARYDPAVADPLIDNTSLSPPRPARLQRRVWSVPVRLHVSLLVLAAVLPLLLLAGIFATRYVAAETERFERGVRDAVFDAALILERDLGGTVATLQALGTSRALKSGDLEAFHAQAVAVKEATGADIILRDAGGRQRATTFVPWGSPMPERSALARWDAEIRQGGRPFVTGHYVGVTNAEHSFAVVVPVRQDGEIAWMLHVARPATHLRDLIRSARLPEGAGIGIADRDLVTLARRELHEQAVGTPAAPSAQLDRMTEAEETRRHVARDGREVFSVLRRLPSSGWIVAASVPIEVLREPLRRTLWAGAAAAGGLVAVAFAGAWFFGHRLAEGIRHLAVYGAALDGAQPVAPTRIGIREVDEVAEALATAASRHGLMLHELNHRVRNTLATVDAMSRLSARHASSVADHEARMSERIRALAQTHVLLSGSHWTEARLDEVLRVEVSVHDEAGQQRVILEGPPVMLPARQAVAIGMLAHELCTNAAKHGALSVPTGRVEITWALRPSPAGAPPRLDLTWHERGGPRVTPPTRRGFGTHLIERGIARDLGAELAADYAPDGLRFRLSFTPGANPAPEPWAAARTAPAPARLREPTAS